jgi:predicted alpha-1,2-mannosidase
MGGDQAFVDKLDSVFTSAPAFDDSYYGFTIHEIREMQIVNMGNYAHGNQPIQHMPYLYNYAGQSWKTQQHVREIMDKLYSATPDGYCGDEDNGQTSAWYVFSALGFYPVTPGSEQYVIGSPLFDKATLTLENGKTLTINANNNDKKRPYIQGLKVNGQLYDKSWLAHGLLQNGGEISFEMTDKPNKNWANSTDAVPYSLSIE